MPIIDIIIAVALVVSIVIGFVRGFVKEAISIATLVVAVWAALYFGPVVGDLSKSWLSSSEMQVWFGRILVFAIVLSVGGLIGWGVSKLVRLSVLSSLDRFFGSVFGALRGLLLAALFVLAGQFAGFDNDEWWTQSRLLQHFEVVADWIKEVAPKGYELIIPDEIADELPVDLPIDL
jgi:membrane protein required for colicin V production